VVLDPKNVKRPDIDASTTPPPAPTLGPMPTVARTMGVTKRPQVLHAYGPCRAWSPVNRRAITSWRVSGLGGW
jgi:hypothetical protein